MPDDLVVHERIREACRRYSVEFRGLRCPTDRCPGSVAIKAVRVSCDTERPVDFCPPPLLIGPGRLRYQFECDYECQICGCWGSYYVPVKDPVTTDDGERITYAVQARGPEYWDDPDEWIGGPRKIESLGRP